VYFKWGSFICYFHSPGGGTENLTLEADCQIDRAVFYHSHSILSARTVVLRPQIAVSYSLNTAAFLADRTNGRAYATVLRPSSCLWRYVLWLNGASYSKSYYWKADSL